MKKLYTFRRTLSATVLLMISTISWAYFQVNGICYNVNWDGENVEVTNASWIFGEDVEYYGDIVIPSSVTYNNKTYRVNSIGDFAFENCSSLTSVSIPESVTSIGSGAFIYCSSLTSVPMHESVTNIGPNAFVGCYSLTSISIPKSVTSIGDFAFGGCYSLTTITVDANNPVYDSREGCNAIIETSSNTLISGCQNTIIPESVTSIGREAFCGCTSLTSIEIPEKVTSIGTQAFAECSSLTSISIPVGVTSIGDAAFAACYSITSITVDAKNTVYDSREGCNAIIETSSNTLIAGCQNSIIPQSVTSIGYAAFLYCSSLTSISIPESVTSIGDYAFSWCSSLTSISIPESVTSIGDYAFSWCSSLTSVICYAENVPKLKSGLYGVFNHVPLNDATLYVPASAIEDYKTASQWKDFGTILPLEDIPAGINSVEADETNAPYYTLDGIRVDNPTKKGIYIKNGKKVFVK